MNVAVLGASRKPDRYSYKAVRLLEAKGHTPLPVHPCIREIDGIPVYRTLADVPRPVDTVTVYLSADNSSRISGDILSAPARRVIFNPGAENAELASALKEKGVDVVEACTLVLLETGEF
jgi:predicted CoA-binding protein